MIITRSVCFYLNNTIGLNISQKFEFPIPSMHAKAHTTPTCPWTLDPKYFNGCGLTDGETSERAWSYLGQFSAITKQMTMANRRDTLEIGLFYYYKRNLKRQFENIENRLNEVKFKLATMEMNETIKEFKRDDSWFKDFAQRVLRYLCTKNKDDPLEAAKKSIRDIYAKNQYLQNQLRKSIQGKGQKYMAFIRTKIKANNDQILKIIEDYNSKCGQEVIKIEHVKNLNIAHSEMTADIEKWELIHEWKRVNEEVELLSKEKKI